MARCDACKKDTDEVFTEETEILCARCKEKLDSHNVLHNCKKCKSACSLIESKDGIDTFFCEFCNDTYDISY